jgi:DNA polymerase I-like protein with 3'-5' exonuclease and polymerase domains
MTDWKPPSEFPNLAGVKLLCYDTETRDPNLLTKGPGNIRSTAGLEAGKLVGISLGVGDREGEQWYFPIDHTDIDKPDADNMDKDQVLRFLCDVLGTDVPKLGTNLIYDLGWLATEGVVVGGKQYDVQNAEPLIDENMRSYALKILSAKYGGQGKDEADMYAWQAETFGGRANRKQAKNIWRTPARIVGPYAESDCREPFTIFKKQQELLAAENLSELFELETRIVPLLHAMRERGVLVNIGRAEEVLADLTGENSKAAEIVGNEQIDVWAQTTIVAYCERQGLSYEETEAGNPSFPSKWLEEHDDEVLRRIADVRRFDTNAGKFVKGTILDHAIQGRIHCQFNQLRGDQYGTVSGRFSSSNPNLQNIPVRDEILGPLLRGMFIPDPGELWYSDDWSQIEYRLLVHYANMEKYVQPSALRAMNQYKENPEMSFHKWVAELTGLEYGPAKNMNFGLAYGMGKAKMAADMGVTMEEAAPLFNQYHETLPFVRKLGWNVAKKAERSGYIKTIMNRRRRFELWEPSDFDKARESTACGFEKAREQWTHKNFHTKDEAWFGGKTGLGIKRAYAYKALNALLQGSAADIMKIAMAECWESGVCDVLGAPLLTVHDELNWSVPDTPEGVDAHAEAVRIMNRDRGLKVPMITEFGKGSNWAEAH